MRVLAGILVVLPLLVGSGGPEMTPEYPSADEVPFPFDPSLVEGKLLGWVQVEAGRSVTHTRTWYDPDGDEAWVQIIEGPPYARVINRPKAGSYTILWTPQEPQTTAIVVRITDNPRTGQPLSDTGTILIQVLPRQARLAPRSCGGPPQ